MVFSDIAPCQRPLHVTRRLDGRFLLHSTQWEKWESLYNLHKEYKMKMQMRLFPNKDEK